MKNLRFSDGVMIDSKSKWNLVCLLGLFVCIPVLLGFAPESFAQEVAAAATVSPPSATQKLLAMVPMFVMVFFIFFLMVQLPEQKEQKAHAKLLEELQKGEEVITTSGLFGRVAGIEKDYILLEVATGVKVKVDPTSLKKKVA
jgi:preprotein translocase subunit YajC